MASESVINGTYAPQNGYGSLEQNHSGYSNSSYQAPANAPAPSSNNSAADIPKDEVGWYFVEQYYTTLSRSPEKVYLFYNKRSQFVSGNETEKVAVCVGQKAINDRIKELDFHDCKVRVTNVDSQASDDHIVIQVIGEISNKSAPHKKFTQTFVLAAQTNGYFVLNDIFRYIIDEEDEAETAEEATPAVDDPAPTAAAAAESEPEPEPKTETETETETETLTSSEDPVAVEKDAAKVDQEIEEKILNEKPSDEDTAAPPAAVEGSPKLGGAEIAEAEEAPVAAVSSSTEAAAAPAAAAEEAAPADDAKADLQPEKPKDPEPTPARSPVKQAAQPAQAAQAEKPAAAKPSGPKTWANLAAAAHRVATPNIPVPQPSTSAAAPQPKTAPVPVQAQPAAAPAAASPAATPAATPAAARDASPAASQQDEWTSVGDKRQQNKAQAAAGAQAEPQHRAYIKNVHEGIDAKQLRAAIEKYGEIGYFDVSRPKNCAFVDFKTAEGYKAAIDANPHQIGGQSVIVEERRLKHGSYPYAQRGAARGGRGGSNQTPRGSYQGGRGGGSQRGRGNASRGRGGAQGA